MFSKSILLLWATTCSTRQYTNTLHRYTKNMSTCNYTITTILAWGYNYIITTILAWGYTITTILAWGYTIITILAWGYNYMFVVVEYTRVETLECRE